MQVKDAAALARSYARYFLEVVDDHSLQSPFLFDLYRRVFHQRHARAFAIPEVESLRASLRQSQVVLPPAQLGAGSRMLHQPGTRPVAAIARNGISSPATCAMLRRLVEFVKPRQIVELGTSLGIATLYMAYACRPHTIYTFEGDEHLSNMAVGHFEKLSVNNIALIKGDIDQMLPAFVSDGSNKKTDMVFIDANHRGEVMIRYYHLLRPMMAARSVMVFDDIRWSADMYTAWQQLRQQADASVTIERLTMGYLFFGYGKVAPAHVVL